MGQDSGCGDRGKGSSLGCEISGMGVVMDDLPGQAAVKGKVLNGPSGWGGREGRDKPTPFHQIVVCAYKPQAFSASKWWHVRAGLECSGHRRAKLVRADFLEKG